MLYRGLQGGVQAPEKALLRGTCEGGEGKTLLSRDGEGGPAGSGVKRRRAHAYKLTIKIRIAGHLKDYTGRSAELEVQSARDVLDVIVQLERIFPTMKDRILDEHDHTRPFINIYLNEENIRDLEGELTKPKDGDVIYILPSVAGGRSKKVSSLTGTKKERKREKEKEKNEGDSERW